MASKYARRHYEDTARILGEARPNVDMWEAPGEYAIANRMWSDVHAGFVTLFAEDNPRFDWERFNVACGLD